MARLLLFFSLMVCFSFSLVAEEAHESSKEPLSAEQGLLNEALNFAKQHQEFRDLHYQEHEARFVKLVKEGQSPKILFIGCSDSRVVPELILNTRPGDLFVVRTAGNFVPPASVQGPDGVAATIQYAVEVLNIPHIVVCGHSHCGAIQGLFQKLDPEKLGILIKWLQFGEAAKKMTLMTAKPSTPKEELYALAEKISVIYQLEHLMSYPYIKKLVDSGKIELHGWYFKIKTGELWYYHPEEYRFLPLIHSSSS